VFPGKDFNSPGVVGMLVGDEYGAYPADGQTQPGHSALGLPAGNAGIDQYCVVVITDIVTVTVASGVKGGEIKEHIAK